MNCAGLVVAAYRRHFDVELDAGGTIACVIKGRSQRIAAGDRVEVERAATGDVIVAVAPRASLVYRSDAYKEKLLAANVTQVAAVVAPDISLDEDLLNRWAIAAEAALCRYVIFANKTDLPQFTALHERLAPYRALGYAVVPICAKRDASAAGPWLAGHHTVLVGQSGMGKSTLINAISPGAGARTEEVSAALGAGRHTTTSTTLRRLPQLGADTWVVDSPGMKLFGLAHLDADALAHAFVEMRPYLGQCRFRDCRHDAEPDCAIRQAIDEGRIAPHRLALLHTLRGENARAARSASRSA